MSDNVNFSLKKNKKDEWYTPYEAVYPILKYIKKGSTIWCPFDKNHSNYVRALKDYGFKVINSHLDINDGDFFKFQPNEKYDYIISNPPFSLKDKIFKRLFDLDKPFMMIMNTNGIYDSANRWDMFNSHSHSHSIMYIKGRVNYMEVQGEYLRSSPPFQSAYICYKISDKGLIFEERGNVNEVKQLKKKGRKCRHDMRVLKNQ